MTVRKLVPNLVPGLGQIQVSTPLSRGWDRAGQEAGK
jgi:hypothetical protein